MPRITIVVRETREHAEVRDVTQEEYDRLMNGDNPFAEELDRKLKTDYEAGFDYAVLDGDGEEYLLPWS